MKKKVFAFAMAALAAQVALAGTPAQPGQPIPSGMSQPPAIQPAHPGVIAQGMGPGMTGMAPLQRPGPPKWDEMSEQDRKNFTEFKKADVKAMREMADCLEAVKDPFGAQECARKAHDGLVAAMPHPTDAQLVQMARAQKEREQAQAAEASKRAKQGK